MVSVSAALRRKPADNDSMAALRVKLTSALRRLAKRSQKGYQDLSQGKKSYCKKTSCAEFSIFLPNQSSDIPNPHSKQAADVHSQINPICCHKADYTPKQKRCIADVRLSLLGPAADYLVNFQKASLESVK
ncbi:unnamed protein product [Arctogadus glacialis]